MLGLTNEQIRSSLEPDSCYEFLQQPWELRNGRCIVKGTNHTFEPDAFGGPFTKYTALFDTRELFDGLRESFLFRAGGHRLERLGEAISGYAPRDTSVDSEALQIVQSYLIDFRDVFVASSEFMDPPAGFSDLAWPVLVDCMCDGTRNFFLSANELLLLCELSKQNAAIFGSDGVSAQFIGAVSGHEKSAGVMVSLHVGRGNQTRVRSHFQRLMLSTEILQIMETLESCIQTTQHRVWEQSAIILADRDSRRHIDWLEQFILRERICMRAEDWDVRVKVTQESMSPAIAAIASTLAGSAASGLHS
jgi:hypothetical protein